MRYALLAIGLVVAAILLAPNAARADGIDDEVAPYVGMRLFGGDGAYLGRLDCNSLGNSNSEHGSQWSSTSIWDPRGPYGRPYSPLSAYKASGDHLLPPYFVDDYGETAVYLTVAQGLTRTASGAPLDTISPVVLEAWLSWHCHHPAGYRGLQ